MQGPYVDCGATNKIEIHHMGKLSKIIKAKNPIHRIMSKLGRKQVSVRKKCHKDIHIGTHHHNESPRKAK